MLETLTESASENLCCVGVESLGPLHTLEQQILADHVRIEDWFEQQWVSTPPPFYASVDLRNAGFKLAPVDTNLFPAGFNNLRGYDQNCIKAIRAYLDRQAPQARRLLLIPENHTRNLFYLENVHQLKSLLEGAGLAVRIGSLQADISAPTRFELPSGNTLLQYPIERAGQRLHSGDFDPDLILLNNDLSAGIPELLSGLEQPITPTPGAGWSRRRKSRHFAHYRDVALAFCEMLGLDAWRIDPAFRKCSNIDFMQKSGLDCLTKNVDNMLVDIRAKYREHGITRDPFVVVKADAGTYGMGIMMVKSGDEIVQMNRKQRNKMATVKEGASVSDVFIQEGVFSFETIHAAVAEPVVYMIDKQVVGGFYRVHTQRSNEENLNAPGMHFEPLPFNDCQNLPALADSCDLRQRFYVYGVIARLALVAAARELAEIRSHHT